MLLSLNWLHEFVPYEGTTQELAERLTMLGLELEDIIYPYEALNHIITGHIITCKRHPEADNLSICHVDIGQNELLPIVCGASNVSQNQKVSVACINTVMPNGLIIKKNKIRGIESLGMICSEEELGLGKGSPGIMILPENTPVGVPFINTVPLDKEVLKISITPNRGDCLSVLGIAREIALAFHLPLKQQKPIALQKENNNSHEWSINITPESNCSLYQLYCIENVSVSPSPLHIRQRLHAVGIQSKSNVIDITNYILIELGQPLHAYDMDTLTKNTINITLAREGEHIHTLDKKKYSLKSSDVLICDNIKPIALGGIIGCKETEITEHTKNILLESAVFDPGMIRKTARRLNITSEAGYRFERGIDQGNTCYALEEAAQRIISIAGGIKTDICSYTQKPYKQPIIKFSITKAESLLGMSIPNLFYSDTFTRLGCEVSTSNPAYWDVKAPTWRKDINQDIDLIEEIIRVKGLESIPENPPVVYRSLTEFGVQKSLYNFSSKIRHWASNLGLNEVINYSFISNKDLDALNLSTDNKLFITNPLTEEQNVLRTSIIPSLLQNVRYNIAHGNTGLRLFEVASTYTFDPASETTAAEHIHLGIVMHGELFDTGWPQPRVDVTYLDLLGIIDHFMNFLCLKDFLATTTDAYSFLNPGVVLSVKGHTIGYIGRITKKIASSCHTHKDIWVAELYLEVLKKLYETIHTKIQPLPIYPGSYRDITIISKISTPISVIKQYLEKLPLDLLDHIILLDVFEPKETLEHHSTFRLYFRHAERTLKDIDVDIEYQKIVFSLTNNFSIRISQ